MNIFVLDEDPVIAALWLDDKRKNKMVLETAQLLSTAININDPFLDLPVYKSTHVNHPCAKWTRQKRSNYSWLLAYLEALGEQWGQHKSLLLLPFFQEYEKDGWFPEEGGHLLQFNNSAAHKEKGLDFKHESVVPLAYRKYLCSRWNTDTFVPRWKKGQEPKWRHFYGKET